MINLKKIGVSTFIKNIKQNLLEIIAIEYGSVTKQALMIRLLNNNHY